MDTLNSSQGGMPREQMRALLDARLSVAKRVGFGLLALVGICTAIGFGKPVFSLHTNWDDALIYQLFMIFAFLMSLAWAILTGWAAISGVVRRTHRPWIVATTLTMGFFYLVLLMFIFVVPISNEESRAILGTQLALIGFFLLNTIGLCTILGVLYRGQFRSQEKLLEIEYRLADLAEKLGERKQG
jgi:uncharacterized membrane protein YozB (DUF420 family)